MGGKGSIRILVIDDNEELTDGRKVIVEQVTIRAARSGKNPPSIVSIPHNIADKAKLRLGDTKLMFTNGDKVIITRPEMPKV